MSRSPSAGMSRAAANAFGALFYRVAAVIQVAVYHDLAWVTKQVVGQLVRRGEPLVPPGESRADEHHRNALAVRAEPAHSLAGWPGQYIDREVLLSQIGDVRDRSAAEAEPFAYERGQVLPILPGGSARRERLFPDPRGHGLARRSRAARREPRGVGALSIGLLLSYRSLSITMTRAVRDRLSLRSAPRSSAGLTWRTSAISGSSLTSSFLPPCSIFDT